MALAIIWADAAIEDFEYIVNYYESYSIVYAKKIVVTTLKVLDYIAYNPHLGSSSSIAKIKNKSVLRRFSLVYKLDEELNQIQVLRFWDNRRNPQDKYRSL